MAISIKKIVYASDVLSGSKEVFKFALHEACKHQAKIYFLHVVEKIDVVDGLNKLGYLPKSAHDEKIKSIQLNEANKLIEHINNFLELEVENYVSLPQPEVVIKFGDAAACIIHFANEIQSDLIVMGDRSSNSITHFFLGSTAHKVIRNSRVPVIVVPINL